jgi:hypothetical protein
MGKGTLSTGSIDSSVSGKRETWFPTHPHPQPHSRHKLKLYFPGEGRIGKVNFFETVLPIPEWLGWLGKTKSGCGEGN